MQRKMRKSDKRFQVFERKFIRWIPRTNRVGEEGVQWLTNGEIKGILKGTYIVRIIKA